MSGALGCTSRACHGVRPSNIFPGLDSDSVATVFHERNASWDGYLRDLYPSTSPEVLRTLPLSDRAASIRLEAKGKKELADEYGFTDVEGHFHATTPVRTATETDSVYKFSVPLGMAPGSSCSQNGGPLVPRI